MAGHEHHVTHAEQVAHHLRINGERFVWIRAGFKDKVHFVFHVQLPAQRLQRVEIGHAACVMRVGWTGQDQFRATAACFQRRHHVQRIFDVLGPGDTHWHQQNQVAFQQAQPGHQGMTLRRQPKQHFWVHPIIDHMDPLRRAAKKRC